MKDVCSNNEKKPLISLDQALRQICNSLSPVSATERIALSDALGRILADPVISTHKIPAENVSSMDGYAFSSQEIKKGHPFTLKQVGISWAGRPFSASIKAGECVRIFTGAVLPPGADSVIMQEQVTLTDDVIQFPADCPVQRYIRSAGSDVKPGQILLKAHHRLSEIDCALLASVGIYSVSVVTKIRIAFFSTGDELQSPGNSLKPGQIYNSNRFALQGLLNSPAYSVSDLGILPDDKALIENTLQHAAKDFDVLISTGGASVGDADFVAEKLGL